ncbi:hypothetical protein BGX21_007606, partial [Mortierella sp. AD011]
MHKVHPYGYKYNSDVEESDSGESDSENSENNTNTNNNHNNGSKGKGVNDKTGKNSPDRFRCQMVISAATSTEPELGCGRPYVVSNGARAKQRGHMDKDHPGVRSAVLSFRYLQQSVQDPESLISKNIDDSHISLDELKGCSLLHEELDFV